jgi:predicted metal-dependent enzyme (double-stranded beta helix superfamily)
MRVCSFTSSALLATTLLVATSGWTQDGGLDAVVAAPASHHIIMENERVRVLRVTIAPGVTEPIHIHPWPSIMYLEAPQPLTYITYSYQGGRWVERNRVELPAGRSMEVQWMGPEGVHAVQNRGTSVYRALRVELKPPQAGSPATRND